PAIYSLPVLPTIVASYTSSFLFPADPPPEIYTLSLHDALPICAGYAEPRCFHGKRTSSQCSVERRCRTNSRNGKRSHPLELVRRSEEHTSELQSRVDLVCRLLLEKKKKQERQQDNTNTQEARKA